MKPEERFTIQEQKRKQKLNNMQKEQMMEELRACTSIPTVSKTRPKSQLGFL